MLNFKATWSKPVNLIDGAAQNLTYFVEAIENIPESPGAYVFARVHGGRVVPLYIGETSNLYQRLCQHFKNNVKLMNSIKTAPTGKRVVIFCTIKTKSEKRRDSILAVLQKSLIEHTL